MSFIKHFSYALLSLALFRRILNWMVVMMLSEHCPPNFWVDCAILPTPRPTWTMEVAATPAALSVLPAHSPTFVSFNFCLRNGKGSNSFRNFQLRSPDETGKSPLPSRNQRPSGSTKRVADCALIHIHEEVSDSQLTELLDVFVKKRINDNGAHYSFPNAFLWIVLVEEKCSVMKLPKLLSDHLFYHVSMPDDPTQLPSFSSTSIKRAPLIKLSVLSAHWLNPSRNWRTYERTLKTPSCIQKFRCTCATSWLR